PARDKGRSRAARGGNVRWASPPGSVRKRERGRVLVEVVLGDQHAVEELLFSRGAGLARLDVLVGFLNRLGGEGRDRLQHGILQLAGLDRGDRIGRAVEAADLDLAEVASFLEGRDGAER